MWRARIVACPRVRPDDVVLEAVEEDADRQTASAFRVPATQRVQIALAVVARALLRAVDVEGDVGQTGRSQFDQQVAGGLDAVGEQRRAQAAAGQAADDSQQLVAAAQRRLAAPKPGRRCRGRSARQ